jgi:glycosyltransferase involved in cell wall biosynthesis
MSAYLALRVENRGPWALLPSRRARFTTRVRPRVAIAHEWLVSYGGSERCVEEMLAVFPDATLLTTLVDPAALPDVLRPARSSLLQRVPGAVRHHEWFVPLMPLAWHARPELTNVDAVISSSHACAKAVRAPSGVPHLCYCYTPMRYAWNFEAERTRFPGAVRPLARAGMGWFRRWDRETARRVTHFIAISNAVARRINAAYGRTAQVIHPPIKTDFFTPGGARGDHFLYVSRLVGYKRPELVIEAFADLPYRLLVVGEGAARAGLASRATPNVEFLGHVDDVTLRDLYRSARALIHPADEDFGIVMAEAQACGTPVIAAGEGGAADIVDRGRTGWLVDNGDLGAWRAAVRRAAAEELDPSVIALAAQRFSTDRFRTEIGEAVEGQIAQAKQRAA